VSAIKEHFADALPEQVEALSDILQALQNHPRAAHD
jgi:hypothetical protein